MSNRKCKKNDENLCPIASKRSKSTTNSPIKFSTCQPAWIAAKLESASSPSGLTNEYLEEMGVGLLDSEESSSSATSAISLTAAVLASVASSNTDENCNEATPNLDAPKFHHHQQQRSTSVYRSLDQTADNSNDGINSFADSNDAATQIGSNIKSSSSNNNSFEIYTDESSLQQQKTTTIATRKTWIQHKTVAILTEESPDNGSSNGNSSRKRSPLATVTCNSQQRRANAAAAQQQQQELEYQAAQLSSAGAGGEIIVGTPSNSVHFGGNQIDGAVNSISPSSQLPSTSQQAALLKHQQQLKQLQTQQKQQQKFELEQQEIERTDSIVPLQQQEDFFLFRNRQMREQSNESDMTDYFGLLSDEIILQVFKWLPKKTLLRCTSVCRRFQQCATDESLWSRLDLGGRSLRPEVMDHILSRGVVVLRLAQANLREPVFQIPSPHFEFKGQSSKLQYLDLSLAEIDKPSLRILLSYCRHLKKLSLEHVALNNDICNEIAENTNLEALNLAMCRGLEAWSVRKMLEPLKSLHSLNISWTNLSVDSVTALVTHVTPNLMRLNVAGCRKTMFDSHVASLSKRCQQLLELDLSDCTGLTGNVINILCTFKMLEYLSLSRCYLIPAMSYLELKNLRTLTYLDVFGTLSDPAMDLLERTFPGLGVNKFVHSSVARPTVGTRRTSIWGLRTRD